MAGKDYYSTLGVSPDASDEEIKKAYRRLVFDHHPDRNPNSKEADEKIRDINAAYEVIGHGETRKTYDRLRFGEENREAAPDVGMVLRQMEEKVFDEGRKDFFTVMIQNVKRIHSELALIRRRTVEEQGYDSFKEAIVLRRAAEVLSDFITLDMETREKRLLDVAVQMMISQRVVGKQDKQGINHLRHRFKEIFRGGRLMGFRSALELFYQRQ